MKIVALIKKLTAIHKHRGNVEVWIEGDNINYDQLKISDKQYLSNSGRKQIGVLIGKKNDEWDKLADMILRHE
mgnify:CR=1 FL=1